MTAPIEEEEVVVSLRLQPVVARPEGWRGRSSSFVAVGLVAFIAVGIALGAAFDGGVPASSAAAVEPSVAISPATTPRTNATRQPRLPALPALQVIGGTFPTERRLVYAHGPQVLDLGTGRLTSPPRPYEDIVLPVGDEMVCACMVPESRGPERLHTLRFERFDTNGAVLVERDVLVFEGVVEVPEMSPGITAVATVSTDQRSLFVVTAIRHPPVWTIELHHIDVNTGALLGSTVIAKLPVAIEPPEATGSALPSAAPSLQPYGAPPDGVYVWANWMAKSPDGMFLAVTVSYAEVDGDTWTNGVREWMIPLSEDGPGAVLDVSAATSVDPNGWCMGPPEFLDHNLLVQVCTSGEGSNPGTYVRRVTTAGVSLDRVQLPSNATEHAWYALATALDRSRLAVLAWDPVRHSLARVSMADDSILVRDVARSMLPEAQGGNGRGYFGADPGLVVSPDGERIYALGVGLGPSDAGTPTGIWVFDAETLNLVDHWLPRAMLTSLGVSPDGQFVYAAGANGFDVKGIQNQWPSSVTVYDAATGEIQVIFGDVATDVWLSFRQLP
jgi:hypothetical protein